MALNMEETYPDAFEDKEMSEEMQRKLQSILEKYQHLSDEEKEQFQQGAFDVLTKSLKNKLHSNTTIWPISYHSMILFISAVLLVVFLLVIVARKLYKRAKERENRKEMKRKLKEQKAAKKKK